MDCTSKSSYLVLENGKVFKGKSFGATKDIISEIVFTTGMTGYLETLTDKSYHGQITVQTFPLIGNYGVIPKDFESESVGPKGYIVKHWCETPSNFRSEGNLDTFFKEQNVTGLYDIDTRALTKIIRENGVMNGMITSNPETANIKLIQAYKVENAVEAVSVKEPYTVNVPDNKYTVALLDFGLKENIKRELLKRGCNVIVLPHNTNPEEILQFAPDGIMLSNGPGDPLENTEIIDNLKTLMNYGIPIFGICLGHQLLALANGGTTTKLKYGHRGANQPVKDIETGRVYITSQNHGYAVVSDSLDLSKAKITFINANDKTCEGIEYTHTLAPVFSVQFHPEACSGPKDTAFLFNKFIQVMEEQKNVIR